MPIDVDSGDGLVDNSENIKKIINSFDKTLTLLMESEFELSEAEVENFFINEAKSSGLEIISMKSQNPNAKLNLREIGYSDEYHYYASLIASPSSFNSGSVYSASLNTAISEVRRADMPQNERQILVDNMMFMDSFVNWMDYRNNLSPGAGNTVVFGCDGWWACWGRCTAGTIGSSLMGGISSCGVGAMVGGGVGTIVPGVGTAAGLVGGCAAAGVLGVIGGAMVGGATFCS